MTEKMPPELANVAVLVVDDNEDTRDMLREVLESHGATTAGASSASEALELVSCGHPDIIFSDIGMPGEDGYSLIRRIRELPVAEGGRTPAAAVSAFQGAQDRLRALREGFQMYLVKPVDLPSIIAAAVALARMTFCAIPRG